MLVVLVCVVDVEGVPGGGSVGVVRCVDVDGVESEVLVVAVVEVVVAALVDTEGDVILFGFGGRYSRALGGVLGVGSSGRLGRSVVIPLVSMMCLCVFMCCVMYDLSLSYACVVR